MLLIIFGFGKNIVEAVLLFFKLEVVLNEECNPVDICCDNFLHGLWMHVQAGSD
jgi:hypothetical protein